jgi:hypothetical protein
MPFIFINRSISATLLIRNFLHITLIKQRPQDRVLSIQGGNTYHADSIQELYSMVIIDIWRACQDFVSFLACHRDILSSGAQKCRVLSFGSFDSQAPIVLALQDHLTRDYAGSVEWNQHDWTYSATANIRDKDYIAIVGMSGSFPDAENLDQFWEVIQKGLDMHREASSPRRIITNRIKHKLTDQIC